MPLNNYVHEDLLISLVDEALDTYVDRVRGIDIRPYQTALIDTLNVAIMEMRSILIGGRGDGYI